MQPSSNKDFSKAACAWVASRNAFSCVDEVVVWPNGKAYFFKGNEYASYDIIADKTDPGYPKPIK